MAMWDITKHGPWTGASHTHILESSRLCHVESWCMLKIVSQSQLLIPDCLSTIGHGILGTRLARLLDITHLDTSCALQTYIYPRANHHQFDQLIIRYQHT